MRHFYSFSFGFFKFKVRTLIFQMTHIGVHCISIVELVREIFWLKNFLQAAIYQKSFAFRSLIFQNDIHLRSLYFEHFSSITKYFHSIFSWIHIFQKDIRLRLLYLKNFISFTKHFTKVTKKSKSIWTFEGRDGTPVGGTGTSDFAQICFFFQFTRI